MEQTSTSKSSYAKLPDLFLRILFTVLGMGTLFAYNAFISCIDYYNALHPHAKNISGQMVTYQLSSMFVTTLFLLPFSTMKNSSVSTEGYRGSMRRRAAIGHVLQCLDIYSPAKRVLYGFVFTFLFLFVYVLLPQYYITSTSLNIFSIFVGIADATSQSGLYILASSCYSEKPILTASATLGGALSGLIVSLLRLATRASYDANSLDGLGKGADLMMRLAFGFSFFLIVAILIIMRDVQRSKQYMHVGDVISSGGEECADTKSRSQSDGGALCLEMVHDPSIESNAPSLMVANDGENETREISTMTTLCIVYWNTWCLIWKPAVSAFLNFFITLSLFPGVLVDIPISKAKFSFGNWLPIVLITLFNLSDCLGRYILSFESNRPFQWLMSRHLSSSSHMKQGHLSLRYYRYLVWFPTWARGIFFPLFAMCILPSGEQTPIFDSDVLRCLIVFLFGLSNGFIQCANFTVAPTLVESEEMKNAVSLLLLLAIYCGLSFGAFFGLLVEKIIRSL
jgi:Nucleoside transporter.